MKDPLEVVEEIKVGEKSVKIYSLQKLEKNGIKNINRLPFSIKILLESVLRNVDDRIITKNHVLNICNWNSKLNKDSEIPFIPARVVLQDFTGVPAVVDLAAMRSAMERFGKDPSRINPLVPVDLVIDHSIQVDYYGNKDALEKNQKREFKRNYERYSLLKWAQNAFENFRVIPPGRGIVHQINLEYLASIVQLKEVDSKLIAYPDTLVGTDSHTTMINGIGVLGWGVGGIEAEAVMLGQPYYMPIPEVIGVRLIGKLKENVTATDLVLTITQMLRQYGVVGKFVEFFGSGLGNLSLPDRATISNMSPEYGATCGFFPIDDQTLDYLLLSGRDSNQVELIRTYVTKQNLFYNQDHLEPLYTDILELDLGSIEPSLAGPKRPQDRIALSDMKRSFNISLQKIYGKKISTNDLLHDDEQNRWGEEGGCSRVERFTDLNPNYQKWLEKKTERKDNSNGNLKQGSVVIAAITSCTNTSNPSVLIGAGLLAKKAVEKGIEVESYVKTSLAPGSRVVKDYLEQAGLLPYLEKLGFNIVGYGCTTCIGNSGPLNEEIEKEIQEKDLVVAAVLSGNRNFEGRINPFTKANYLASPLLVVAYALAGTIDINFDKDPIGFDKKKNAVYLKDIWPNKKEIEEIITKHVTEEMFKKQYAEIFTGTEEWEGMKISGDKNYAWDKQSTYIKEPPFFIDFPVEPAKIKNINNAYVLALLGDTITTDHISPAGAIPANSSAGKYLNMQGIQPIDFNSFGSRRGNHEVMMRGTFGNIRLRNQLASNKEGGWTKYIPTGEIMTIFDAAMRYKEEKIPLIVLAGKEYGTGSSRDWAAKGTLLLGIKAVIAESFERIHRSNLVGMGILPLEFMKNENAEKLKLNGNELFNIQGIDEISANKIITIIAENKRGSQKRFNALVRLDSQVEVEYYKNGGILQTVLRSMLSD